MIMVLGKTKSNPNPILTTSMTTLGSTINLDSYGLYINDFM